MTTPMEFEQKDLRLNADPEYVAALDEFYRVTNNNPLYSYRSFVRSDLLWTIVKLNHFQDVLEVGTSYGKTAFLMGKAVESFGGSVTTININQEEAEMAAKILPGSTTVMVEDSLEALPKLIYAHKKYDLVLVDGSHNDFRPISDYIFSTHLVRPAYVIALDDINMVPVHRTMLTFREIRPVRDPDRHLGLGVAASPSIKFPKELQ